MAMIKCAECGKEFSDRANACPNCGCPIEYQAEKSIGGEYHAADKLAPSVIVEHLTIAKELESERYTLQMAIPQITNRINQLGYSREIVTPKNKSVSAFLKATLISFAIVIVIYFVILSMSPFILLNLSQAGIVSAPSLIPGEVNQSENLISTGVMINLISATIGLVIIILSGCLAVVSAKKKYKVAVQQYNNAIAWDKSRVNNENIQKQQLQLQKEDIQKKIGDISETRENFYSLDIIHPKYRNMITVIRLLEYFDSGRCTALTGAGGAYNKYEKEIRQDAIISKLDTAINCLYQIRDTQYMLYESLEDCLDELGAITTQNDKLISTNQDISQNSAIAAYNSKIAASNSDALVFIEAYKGANGL